MVLTFNNNIMSVIHRFYITEQKKFEQNRKSFGPNYLKPTQTQIYKTSKPNQTAERKGKKKKP